MKLFLKYFRNKRFSKQKQRLCKKHGCFLKLVDIDNNKLMGLLTIAGGSLLLSQEHIKEKRKQRRIFGLEREIVQEHIIRSYMISA